MMWRLVILLGIALSVDSYGIHERDEHERLTHGRQLKIYLPKNVARLEFIPAGSYQMNTLWEESERHTHRGRGRVTGDGSDRRWYLDKVTFEDEGTYTRKDFWNKEISNVKVAIVARSVYSKCIAGESLKVDLEGLRLEEANLDFSSEGGNYTLVRDGATVSQDLADYFDRVKTHSYNIEIRHVNTSDEGRYYLRDRKARLVSVTRMDLTDEHEGFGGNPLMALLLLLGIPAGVCCCCRKKIFKQKSSATTTHTTIVQSSPQMVHPDPHGPGVPPPDYNTPGPGAMYYHGGPDPNVTGPMVHPPPGGQGQWNGPPPDPGFNPAYPPQNPMYPPSGPAMYAPAQPQPQWNGPPPGQYGPPPPGQYGPGPMAAPVQYSAPPPTASEPVKMDIAAPSPTDPLLSAPKPDGSSPAATTDEAYTFQISTTTSNTTSTTTNFL